jgi:DNA mismatch endonuclease (patch repair protein)
MPDVHSAEQRSFNMSRIRSKDTKPEMIVRSIVHQLGYRFRLHVKGLPGTPDLVFPKQRKIIFVHGCFWHMHRCRYGRVTPATNAEFWRQKREGNVTRDRRNRRQLRNAGWSVMVVPECWTKDVDRKLLPRLIRFLQPISEQPQDESRELRTIPHVARKVLKDRN